MAKRNISRRTFLNAAGTGIFGAAMSSKAHAKTKKETIHKNDWPDHNSAVRQNRAK